MFITIQCHLSPCNVRFKIQAKTHVPYSSIEKLSEKDVKNERLTQRLHGVIIHGVGSWVFRIELILTSKGANQGLQSHSEIINFMDLTQVSHVHSHNNPK